MSGMYTTGFHRSSLTIPNPAPGCPTDGAPAPGGTELVGGTVPCCAHVPTEPHRANEKRDNITWFYKTGCD